MSTCIIYGYMKDDLPAFLLIQGGIKAVVWTDVFQFLVMLAGILTLLFKVRLLNETLSVSWKKFSASKDILLHINKIENTPSMKSHEIDRLKEITAISN